MDCASWAESDRLAALDRYNILDSETEQEFDDVVKLTAQLLDAPIAVVNLIARERQWFKAEVGLGVRQMPLDDSICKHALFESDRMIICDTLLDPRFSSNPLVTGGPGLRFYAGELLKTADGFPLGTLCVLDTEPRPEGLTPEQEFALQTLARQIMSQMELRKLLFEQSALLAENQRTAQALRRERDRAHHLFTGMDEGFVQLDADFRIREISPGGLRMDGRPEHELVGRTHWDVWPGSEELPVGDAIRRAMQDTAPAHLEQIYVFPDGRRFWLDVRVVPTEDGVALFYRDITARKEAERKLHEANRRKDEFLAMLAHELRNPLAPITSAAHVLASTRLDTQRAPALAAIISRQAKHMTALVDDLLDVSRVTRGLVALDKQAVEAKAVIASAVEQVRPLLEKKGHELSLHISSESAVIDGDRDRLVQIVSNLLNNAARYTPSGGHVRVALDVQPDVVEISVVDNGSGMSQELIDQCFELFTQGERSADRTEGGLGIGLALVRSLVALHGGSVEARSEGSGRGSTFTVTLPRKPAAPQDKSPASPRQEERNGGLRVGIVDDNEDAAITLGLFLETCGYETAVSHWPHEAIEQFRSFRPDVAILDIGMPEMNGYELAGCLRSMPETADAVLVALTGYGQESDRAGAMEAGFDHHLVKPVQLDALRAFLQEIWHYRPRRSRIS
ncbi:ATP-binding protein [Caldimonas tepidiphila]|uniref:ATP-binding protein n=1 Tax=Caldimonas tepidiphila TaxID=2315841 RepID=UPI000E5C43B5|nr:ATP-binding protein [Caldimonas tepidiphila]